MRIRKSFDLWLAAITVPMLFQVSGLAVILNYDLSSPSGGDGNYSIVDRDEAYDGETVQHNIDYVDSSFRMIAVMDIAESLDSITIRSLSLKNNAPLVISDSVDLGPQGSVPYEITVKEIQIELSEKQENIVVNQNGQLFSPSGGYLPVDYYHEGTIEISGETTDFSFTSGGAFDIHLGDLDLGRGGRFLIRLVGKTGIGNTTIFSGTRNDKPITIGLMMDNYINIDGPCIPVYWNQFPFVGYSYVDTGDWLGTLFLDYAPFVWSEDLDKWLYVPNESASSGRGWVFWHR